MNRWNSVINSTDSFQRLKDELVKSKSNTKPTTIQGSHTMVYIIKSLITCNLTQSNVSAIINITKPVIYEKNIRPTLFDCLYDFMFFVWHRESSVSISREKKKQKISSISTNTSICRLQKWQMGMFNI